MRIKKWLLYAIVMGTVVGCSTIPTDPKHRDLLGMVRAYQYLQVFSIWQENLPQDPIGKFDNSEQIARAIHDTLKGESYTNYWRTKDDAPPYLFSSSSNSGLQAVKALSKTVYYSQLTPLTAYIWITSFDSSTVTGLRANVNWPQNIILDLREDGGGLIWACTSAVELFLPEQRHYINVSSREFHSALGAGITKRKEPWLSTHTGDIFEGKRVAILIDGGSASASEIMAVALRDGMDQADVHLFGAQSYGKGIGQYIFTLRDNAVMRITGFHFYRATGDTALADYHRKGILPDVFTKDTIVVTDSTDSHTKSSILTDAVYKAGVWLQDNEISGYGVPILTSKMGRNGVMQKALGNGSVYKRISTDDLPLF